MQARRPITPPPAAPTSSIAALLHDTEARQAINDDCSGAESPAQASWTSLSPTQTLGHSSPELPTLPTLAVLGGLPQTPPDNPPSENDHFFTASWGSPYPRQPPGTSSRGEHAEQDPEAVSSSDVEDDSILHFGLDHLLPSRLPEDLSPELQFDLEHLLPARFLGAQVTPNTGRFDPIDEIEDTPRPSSQSPLLNLSPDDLPSGLTRERFKQLLLQSSASKDADWWSDGSDHSDHEKGGLLEVPKKESRKGHKSKKTLKQEDFWAYFSKPQQETIAKMMSSRFASGGSSVKDSLSNSDRSGPVSPAFPKGAAAQSQGHSRSASKELPPLPHTPSKLVSPAATSAPLQAPVTPVKPEQSVRRPRKKMVSKKNKACWVDLPADIQRGGPGQPPKVMSVQEVEAKLSQFEQQGYDTRGFGHWSGIDQNLPADVYAQNRAIHPDPSEGREEMKVKSFQVHIPNEAEWKAYQQLLVEEKLKALGVSLGDDEPAAAPSLSRQSSAQYPPLPFSPPLPSSSAGSFHRSNSSVAIGTMGRGPSPGHLSRGSIASPISAISNPRMHMHRHSTFTSPSQFHGQPTPPGLSAWSPSPQQYFASNGVPRGGSPALGINLPTSRPDLITDLMSPGSPFGMSPNQALQMSQKDDLLAHLQQQQQQIIQQQNMLGLRPASTLAEVPEDEAEEEDNLPQSPQQISHINTDIAIPTPRGHRHNISENLERGVQDADYHLEKEIDRQLNEGGQFSPGVSRFGLAASSDAKPTPLAGSSPPWEMPRPVEQVLHHPQPHARAHSLTQSHSKDEPFDEVDLTDDDDAQLSDVTNPSAVNTKGSALHSAQNSQGSNAWKPGHGSRTSKASMSNLKADAKEFVFNPGTSFKAFSSFGSQPSTASPFSPSFPSAVTQSFPPLVSKPSHSSNRSSGGFNFSAPAFEPGKTFNSSAPAFEPNKSLDGSMPSSDFNFSASTSSFKPDAPAFEPSLTFSRSTTSVATPDTTLLPSIFGNVNFNEQDIVKPAKRSKAIPIVRPDTTPKKEVEEEEHEDADGRITQSDARQKRARRGADDGDSVPQFASSPQPLAEVDPVQAKKQQPQVERSPALEDKENFIPASAAEKANVEAQSVQKTSDVVEDVEKVGGSEDDESNDTPVESDLRDETRSLADEDNLSTPSAKDVRQPFQRHSSKGSLSATAKPFEPSFGGSNFTFGGFHLTKPSIEPPREVEPDTTPSRNFSNSPAHTAHTFRTDGSWKTALEERKHQRYPDNESQDYDSLAPQSFNEIDEVMKHMNDEGSDFGVERDEQSWGPSPQRRMLHEFQRAELRPDIHLRSDAPSPSPRRVYHQPQLQRDESGSITQDPFDDERARYESPIRRLNNGDDVPVSDWDDVVSPNDEEKFHARRSFFDNHVDSLINDVLESRLGPLQDHLRIIQESISTMSRRGGRSSRREYSTDRQDSDADDEDDDVEEARFRNRSPIKDRRFEKIRSIINEALSAHSQQQPSASAVAPISQEAPAMDLKEFYDILSEMKSSIAEQRQKEIIEPETRPSQELEEIYRAIAEMKTSLAEHLHTAMTAVPADPAPVSSPPLDMTEFYQAFGDMKVSLAKAASGNVQLDDFKDLLEDALDRQRKMAEHKNESFKAVMKEALARQHEAIERGRDDFKLVMEEALKAQFAAGSQKKEDLREIIDEAFVQQNVVSTRKRESEALMENEARLVELEILLKEKTHMLEQETETRLAYEEREAETSRLLKLTEEELGLLKLTARDEENKAQALSEEVHVARLNLEAYKTAQNDVTEKLDGATNEIEALKATLAEYRLASDKWRDDIHQAGLEKESMQRSAEALRLQITEAMRIREVMRAKIDKLQQDMVTAAGSIAQEKGQWQKTDEEHRTRYEVLRARIEAEARTRERLERELERLEVQEREGMRLRVTLEQTQHANARLEDTVSALRLESQEHQKVAARYEREFREAREAGRNEVLRTRTALEADIERANHEVNLVRANLEAEVGRVRSELDHVRLEAETAKERHELMLEEECDKRKVAVQEALESRKIVLQDTQERYELRLQDLQKQHQRDLRNAHEDQVRSEQHLTSTLALANSKVEHMEDKIKHLEEQLTVSKAAAQAAVLAAQQSAKVPAPTVPSHSFSARGGVPEKISPQALRESIAVLQEQLQERETRIESLEHSLSEVDSEAPAKLKERDTEIGWLRELLGVRVDDLNDLITALAQPDFDRENVRDAAIRIRANLQMEQQEKERLISGSNSYGIPTSLSALSNLATPKAAQLAAAIGNWRKSAGRDSRAGSTASVVTRQPSFQRASQTPSKRPSPAAIAPFPPLNSQSFLSGLMTPPASNVRRSSPQPGSSQATPKLTQPQTEEPSAFASTGRRLSSRSSGKQPLQAPRTPPLMRRGSYDQDAESANGYYDDEDSTIDGFGDAAEPALSLERGWEYAVSPRAA